MQKNKESNAQIVNDDPYCHSCCKASAHLIILIDPAKHICNI